MDSALARDPDDASVNFYDGQLLINTGYTRRGIERVDRALAIDPLLPNALHWRAQQFLFAGDIDMAERLWKRAERGRPVLRRRGFLASRQGPRRLCNGTFADREKDVGQPRRRRLPERARAVSADLCRRRSTAATPLRAPRR